MIQYIYNIYTHNLYIIYIIPKIFPVNQTSISGRSGFPLSHSSSWFHLQGRCKNHQQQLRQDAIWKTKTLWWGEQKHYIPTISPLYPIIFLSISSQKIPTTSILSFPTRFSPNQRGGEIAVEFPMYTIQAVPAASSWGDRRLLGRQIGY